MKLKYLFILFFALANLSSNAQTLTTTIKKKTPTENTPEQDKFEKRRFRGMVIAGFNMSQVDGDRMGGYYKFGFNGGVGAFAMIKKKFSISMELLYNMKGAKSQLSNAKYSSRNITLDYADIPIMFNFHDKHIAIFGGGFSIGGLIRKKQVIYDDNGYEQPNLKYKVNGQDRFVTIESYMNNYRGFDFQFVGHATFLIKRKIGIQARFGYSILGLGKVRFPDGNLRDGQQRNNVLSLRMFYMF
jgi:hypothetical protein